MDRGSFEALVRAHQAEVYRYVRYLGADRTTAEDLVQETFLAVLRQGFGRPSPPELQRRRAAVLGGADSRGETGDVRNQSAWLRGVARNIFLMHCRREKKDPVRVNSDSLEKAEAVWDSQFLREGDGFEYVEALRECLGVLSEKQRGLVQLQYFQRKSRSEMASLYRMTADGVKSLMRAVRARLADCVDRRLGAAGG